MKTMAILIAMAATLGTCDALRCFRCYGYKDSSCGESFRASTTVYCYTACYKSMTTMKTVLGTSITYDRGCLNFTPTSMTCSKGSGGIPGFASGSSEGCYCNTDNCNSASNLLPSIVQIVMTVAASCIFQKF
ncbi:uncharacterized protein LOC106176640 [Lingula anatina]|uniref:Uncharacterized protein LOC106176640 n=1 Tax=Lingula anatina TaxID=7574 RepID=A0A1S3JWZ5_LINAN|nr:uncharacterized protein LOC106176640 [Lingula anatina]|eukprot:XP_013414559.1 uncharacterized protein LOC106176640 [Lingula anatina]